MNDGRQVYGLNTESKTTSSKIDAPILDKPFGARVLHEPDGEMVKVSLPSTKRHIWIIPSLYLIIVCPTALVLSVIYGFSYRGWSAWPLFITFGVLALVLWGIWVLCFPRLVIEASREGVEVGEYKFKWEHLSGLRLGYSAGGKEMENRQGPYSGFRMSYGPWGYDLPYMVRGYYSAAYVVWVNMMLQTVDHVPFEGKVNSPEEGFKKDLF